MLTETLEVLDIEVFSYLFDFLNLECAKDFKSFLLNAGSRTYGKNESSFHVVVSCVI